MASENVNIGIIGSACAGHAFAVSLLSEKKATVIAESEEKKCNIHDLTKPEPILYRITEFPPMLGEIKTGKQMRRERRKKQRK